MFGRIKETLDNHGFAEFSGSENDFIKISSMLGKLIPSRKKGEIIDVITPKKQIAAHLNSLSNIYGLEEFPYHTDGAYFPIPPKYVAMRYSKGVKYPTPTKILPIFDLLSNDEKNILDFEIWQVKGHHFNFYTSILTKTHTKNDFFIRFDPGCMTAVRDNPLAQNLFNMSTKIKQAKEINWEIGKILILNNWKFLHSRPAVKIGEEYLRTLNRLMINV